MLLAFIVMGDLVSKLLPEGPPSGQPFNNYVQPTQHRMPDDIDKCYIWRDNTHCVFTDLRAFGHLPNLQEFDEPKIVLKFMYHVYQTLVHISNEHKDKLRELGNHYDYKLEDFHFYVRDNLMEPYQAVWKKYQQALTLFPFEQRRESPTYLHHLHSRQPHNRGVNEGRDRINGIYPLSEPWDSWSLDTNAGRSGGYLHGLNLGNSRQQLNLQGLRDDRPQTLQRHAHNGGLNSHNPSPYPNSSPNSTTSFSAYSKVHCSHHENVSRQNSTQHISSGIGPNSMTLLNVDPTHAEYSSLLPTLNQRTLLSLQNGNESGGEEETDLNL